MLNSVAENLRNLFWILLSQTEIRLYLPFSDWFCLYLPHRTGFRSVLNQAERWNHNPNMMWCNNIARIFVCVSLRWLRLISVLQSCKIWDCFRRGFVSCVKRLSVYSRAFRLVVKLVVNKPCYWLKWITWFILANSKVCLLQL